MALSSAQVERVREIIRFRSVSATETLTSGLNQAQEAETIDDFDEWETLRSDFVEVDEEGENFGGEKSSRY